MKKSMVLFALATIAATGANATKARLNALGGSNWVPVEYQDIFTSPHKMMLLENQAQVEMGPASTFTTATGPSIGSPGVEGGFITGLGAGKVGFHVGRQNTDWNTAVSSFNSFGVIGSPESTKFTAQENPINILYAGKSGEMNWGANLYYMNFESKSTTATLTQNAPYRKNLMGISGSASEGPWAAYLVLGLNGKAEELTATASANDTMTSTGAIIAKGSYKFMDDALVWGKWDYKAGKEERNGTERGKYEQSVYQLGVERKIAGSEGLFFYGLWFRYTSNVMTTTFNSGETKYTQMELPFVLGFETSANSWLDLRGSVTQNVLLGTEKIEVNGAGETDTWKPNTTAAIGASFKFNPKLKLDFTATAGTTGKILDGAATLGTEAGLAYIF